MQMLLKYNKPGGCYNRHAITCYMHIHHYSSATSLNLDPCLQGFLDILPPQAEWGGYTTLDPGLVDSTYIFPFVTFTCNGTLERVTLPFSIRPQDSIFWDNILTAEIVLFRPGMQGYMELFSQLVNVELPGRALFRFRNNDNSIVQAASLDLSLSIQKGDVLGLKLPDSYTALTPNSVVVEDHIPFLMRRENNSPVLRKDTVSTCQACAYQVVDFLVPVVNVQFMPMQSVQGAGTEGEFSL